MGYISVLKKGIKKDQIFYKKDSVGMEKSFIFAAAQGKTFSSFKAGETFL